MSDPVYCYLSGIDASGGPSGTAWQVPWEESGAWWGDIPFKNVDQGDTSNFRWDPPTKRYILNNHTSSPIRVVVDVRASLDLYVYAGTVEQREGWAKTGLRCKKEPEWTEENQDPNRKQGPYYQYVSYPRAIFRMGKVSADTTTYRVNTSFIGLSSPEQDADNFFPPIGTADPSDEFTWRQRARPGEPSNPPITEDDPVNKSWDEFYIEYQSRMVAQLSGMVIVDIPSYDRKQVAIQGFVDDKNNVSREEGLLYVASTSTASIMPIVIGG